MYLEVNNYNLLTQTCLKVCEHQRYIPRIAAATDPKIQDILWRLLKIQSILSTLLGQANDAPGTEGTYITLPDLPSHVAKLEKVANSSTCLDDTSQTSTSLSIEETASFEPLLNISADEEVVESTETFLKPAPRPYPWRAI